MPRLTICNIPRAVRRDSEQHLIEKSVPQEENNHSVDNRDFDRAMKTVTRSSPQPHALPLVTEDPPGKERRSIDHDAIPPVASIHFRRMHQRFQKHPSPSCLNTGEDRLVTYKTCRSYAGACFERVVTNLGCRRSFLSERPRVLKGFGHHSRRTTLICMNAFFARGVTAMRDWWHRNFQSAHYSAVASQAASGKGNWSCSFSAAHSAPAPMIPRPTVPGIVNTGTAAAMGASKAKPSIVRIIRVRRRRPAGEARFLGELAGRKIANS